MNPFFKKPSAWIPIAMSLAAILLGFGYVSIYGITEPQATDEGTAAHLWQFLMGGQIPIILYFAIRWMPRARQDALEILGMQAVTMLTSLSVVYFLEL